MAATLNINFIITRGIPSHVGIKGNEMADRIAQHAITNENIQLDIRLELKEINYCIFQYIDDKWQHIWTTSATGQFYLKIEPAISRNIKCAHQNRVRETTITRLRFGKCRLNEYLAKLNVTDSTKCTQSKAAAETVEHFLLNCPNSDLCGKVATARNSMGVKQTSKKYYRTGGCWTSFIKI